MAVNMGNSNQQRKVNANERQRQALELRKGGVDYATIAQHLGYKDQSGAWRAVNRALTATLQEPADELRKLEVERLDAMYLAVATGIRNGNLGAIDRGIRIMERRAKLLGLDAPIKTEADVSLTNLLAGCLVDDLTDI